MSNNSATWIAVKNLKEIMNICKFLVVDIEFLLFNL